MMTVHSDTFNCTADGLEPTNQQAFQLIITTLGELSRRFDRVVEGRLPRMWHLDAVSSKSLLRFLSAMICGESGNPES